MKKWFLLCIWLFVATCFTESPALAEQKKKTHLFVLSGQSNMAAMKHEESFLPAVEKAFGKENVIVVKSAKSGQPVRRWYKDYKYPDKRPAGAVEILNEDKIGDLYDRMMERVHEAINGRNYDTVTFIWMQGERDAKEGLADVYSVSFKGILKQLKEDLKTDINFVIGRLSDHDLENQKFKHWTNIRDIQKKLAEEDERGEWINCDDLNDGINKKGKKFKNNLHMSKPGYQLMGERFAEKAISLIN